MSIDAQIKKCPKCGSSFECMSESDCWCEKIQIPPKNMKYVLLNYDGCLCKQCLEDEGRRVI